MCEFLPLFPLVMSESVHLNLCFHSEVQSEASQTISGYHEVKHDILVVCPNYRTTNVMAPQSQSLGHCQLSGAGFYIRVTSGSVSSTRKD